MTEFKKPYIGVSGVVSPEIETSLERMNLQLGLPEKGRQLALGVKAVHKTQFLDIENKYGKDWYPIGEEAFNSSLRHEYRSPVILPVAQMYLELSEVANVEYREAFVKRVAERGRPWLKAVQFDMLPWHNNDDMLPFLEDVKESTGLDVLLQVHGPAMRELGPTKVMNRLGNTLPFIDYLLFDASHGTGARLDVEALKPFVAEAYQNVDVAQTGIAIAGGLNEQNVTQDLPELVGEYPNLSWDAEGQLHPLTEDGTRPLDLSVAKEYLAASASILPQAVRDPRAVSDAVYAAETYWFGGPVKRAPFPHD